MLIPLNTTNTQYSTITSIILNSNGNCRSIGILYCLMANMYGIYDILCSVIVRYDLCWCNKYNVGSCGYNCTITLHGLIMIFFMVMPNLYSLLGNVVCIGMLGVCEVSYIRLNLMSWLLLILGVCEALNYCCCEYGIGMGW